MTSTAALTRKIDNLSPAERKIYELGDRMGKAELRKKLNATLGHLADGKMLAVGDGASGLVGWGADIMGRLLVKRLGKQTPEEQAQGKYNTFGTAPAYWSGGFSMLSGALGYLVNLGMPGSKATALRMGARTASTTTFLFGLDRVVTAKFDSIRI